MNIVGIGFYDDFARFFNALKKEACKESNFLLCYNL